MRMEWEFYGHHKQKFTCKKWISVNHPTRDWLIKANTNLQLSTHAPMVLFMTLAWDETGTPFIWRSTREWKIFCLLNIRRYKNCGFSLTFIRGSLASCLLARSAVWSCHSQTIPQAILEGWKEIANVRYKVVMLGYPQQLHNFLVGIQIN